MEVIRCQEMKERGLLNCSEYTGDIIVEDIGIPDKLQK